MKKIIALMGMLMAAQAMSGESTPTQSSGMPGMVTDYHYGMHLDIARVVSHSETPPVCHVVPVEMTYEDSNGNQQTIRYRVMGSGCLGS